jgi:hypothetical protein
MQSTIELKFKSVTDYRKAIGQELLSRIQINFAKPGTTVLEIGPGMHSELVQSMLKAGSVGQGAVFIEPHRAAADKVKAELPKARVIGTSLESEVSSLPDGYFDLIYANFSLHWSDALSDSMLGLCEASKFGASFLMTITDQSRSFWARINQSFKAEFPGCDLFRAGEAKSLDVDGWRKTLVVSGFQIQEELLFSGIASVSANPTDVLENFKKAVGDKYLKLASSVTKPQAEAWLLEKLKTFQTQASEIPIPASGYSFVCKRKA